MRLRDRIDAWDYRWTRWAVDTNFFAALSVVLCLGLVTAAYVVFGR